MIRILQIGAALCLGCAAPLEDPQRFDEGPYCSLDLDVPALFVERCSTECHEGEDPAAGLDLATPGIEERLVAQASHICPGRVRVVPGDPDSSFLVEKVDGSPECGLPMPMSEQPLSQRELACVRSWVRDLEPLEPMADP